MLEVEELDIIDYLIDNNAHGIQSLGLRDSSGETIEDEAVLAVFLGKALTDDTDDHLVGNQLAGFDEALGLQAHFGSVF